jgi:hypothetical protein
MWLRFKISNCSYLEDLSSAGFKQKQILMKTQHLKIRIPDENSAFSCHDDSSAELKQKQILIKNPTLENQESV